MTDARRPTISRRGFLQLAGGAGLTVTGLAGCSALLGETSGSLLTSQLPLPEPFQVPLSVPAVPVPVRREQGTDYYEVVQRAAQAEILPGRKTVVWGYDGTFPGPTFHVRSGQRTVVRVRNELAVPTSTHLHGGRTPPESDGYPTDLVVPSGYRADPRLVNSHHGIPADPELWRLSRETKDHEYPLRQPAATLWYHDHRMDFSAPQVWRGLAGFFLVHDDEEDALPLPKGERDIPLMICDRAFAEDGSFRYPALDETLTRVPGVRNDYMDGVMGDVILVNGKPWPVLEVAPVRYRFRILNASNARRYRLALDPARGAAFVQIGSDNGLLAAPVRHEEMVIAPAERFDVVVDFAGLPAGTHVDLVNTLGEGTTRPVMRFAVRGPGGDDTAVPDRLAEVETLDRGQVRAERTFDFRRSNLDGRQVWTINGQTFDPAGSMADPALDSVELWRFSSDFHHPVHLHLAHFQVLSRGAGPPRPTDAGWKDTVDVLPYEVVEVLARFEGFRGRYMVHCHNLEHEDMAMMVNFDVT